MSGNKLPSAATLPDISIDSLFDILDSSSDGIAVAIPDPWRLAYLNQAMRNGLSAYSHAWRDRPLAELMPALSSASVEQQMERVLSGEVGAATVTDCVALGDAMSTEIRFRRVIMGGRPALAIIAQRAGATATVTPSDVDSLTGLASRSFLLKRLGDLLRGGRMGDQRFAVLFIDLNEFKWVNDTYGHLVGDQALCEVARRLATCVRTGDHICRFGGDEFVVLLEQVRSDDDIQPVLARIHAVLRPPIPLPGGEAILTASIGVAEASPGHRTAEDLLAAADLAMYASKRR